MAAGEKIGIFIPCYNVEKSVGQVLGSFSPETLARIERILAIDNVSRDGTREELRRFKASGAPAAEKLVVIENERNRGLGGSQKIAYRYFLDQGFTHFMVIHGDNQGDGELIARTFLELHDCSPEIDVIMASRFTRQSNVRGYSLARVAGNRFFNGLTTVLTGLKISDPGTGIVFYNARSLRETPFEQLHDFFHFNPELNILLHENKALKIAVVPLRWRDSESGSNVSPIPYCLELTKILAHYGATKAFGKIKSAFGAGK